VFRQTAAVLVAFPTFFTSQIATTGALALALGQPRALAGTAIPRLGVALLVLRHCGERGPVRDGLAVDGRIVAVRRERRAIAWHARRHLRVHGQRGPPELRGGLGQAPRAAAALERRAYCALSRRRHGRNVAGGRRAHALAACDAMCGVHGARRQRRRVRARLGQRAGNDARVTVLRSWPDGNRFLERWLSAPIDMCQSPGRGCRPLNYLP
jgi:hypothetical protein